MKKLLTIFFAVLFFGSVFADGMVVRPDMYPMRQEQQQAFINYENGKENLFIMVNLREAVASGEKNVWIFPVPAKPEEIEINNLKGFPVLSGKEIKQQLTENVFFLETYMATAAFPPLGILPLLFRGISFAGTNDYREMGAEAVSVPGLTIYQHIDKFGIATEVIKAQDAAIFKNFLAARGTNLSSEAEQFLSEYMGKDYSFVVSWISDSAAIEQSNDDYYGYYNRNPIGVFIKFPAEQIYYPLKPTAYYGNDSFPVIVNIAGFKNPEIFSNIKEKTIVGQYYAKFLSHTIQEEESIKAIFNGSLPESLNYTKISINSPANYFTQDLSISPAEAYPAHAVNFINQTWLVWMFLIFIGFAFLAISFTNRIYLGNALQRKDMLIIAILNIFTVIIAALGFALLNKKKFGAKEKESGFNKKIVSLIIFEAIFFGFAVLLFVITMLVFLFARGA